MRCSCDAMRVNANVSGLYLIGGIHIGSQISMAGGVAKTRVEPEARVESDGARLSTTAPDMCGYGSDAPSKPDDAWRSPPRALMSWYGETACSLHGLQETEHVTGSAAFCLDAGESGGPHAGCTQGFTQSHSRTHMPWRPYGGSPWIMSEPGTGGETAQTGGHEHDRRVGRRVQSEESYIRSRAESTVPFELRRLPPRWPCCMRARASL